MAKGKTNSKEEVEEQLNEVKDLQGKEEVSKKEAKKKKAKQEALKQELADAKDKYLRLYSEFENFRRRTAKEKLELVGTANEGLMHSLIPILDDFERADKSFNDEVELKSMKEGIDLIHSKFKNVLEQKGIKIIKVEKGAEFDTELHEAITQIPVVEEELKGKIVDVIENGYQLSDKVIRFAKVVTGA
ncbi:MAG: molecular chaperone GrpE [Cyclobacteriaceae bacterium]|jgi:molecular chaperone GrpE